LQDLLGDYDGTVLLISHDRDFLDRVATTTIAMDGDGRATVYAGGWSDYKLQQKTLDVTSNDARKIKKNIDKKEKIKKVGLSFTQRTRLEALPAEIARLEAEIRKLEVLLAQPDLYTKEPVKFRKATEALTLRQETLSLAEDEWLMLEEKASAS
jgi:ATP-binding cassette subfamily F protein uup